MASRRYLFERLMQKLQNQKVKLPERLKNEFEVLVSRDSGEKTVGQKRNELIQRATGKFVVFIDDDDFVDDQYLRQILLIIDKKGDDIDYIGFQIKCHSSNKTTKHSLKFKENKETDTEFQRNISHINPIKRTIAAQVAFPELYRKEDHFWNEEIYDKFGHDMKEIYINKVMYHYFPHFYYCETD